MPYRHDKVEQVQVTCNQLNLIRNPNLHVISLTEIHLFFMKVPDAFQKLIDNVESTMHHAIVEEEHIPMETVTNFDEVSQCFKAEFVNKPVNLILQVLKH